MRNNLFIKCLVASILLLFVGSSILPVAGNILSEESLKQTEESYLHIKSQSISKDLDYDRYQLYQHN